MSIIMLFSLQITVILTANAIYKVFTFCRIYLWYLSIADYMSYEIVSVLFQIESIRIEEAYDHADECISVQNLMILQSLLKLSHFSPYTVQQMDGSSP